MIYSYIFDNLGTWKVEDTARINYFNFIDNQPDIIVINNDDNLKSILNKNFRHHKFRAISDHDVICEQFNRNFTLDLCDINVYGYDRDKCIILHFINVKNNLKNYIKQFNKNMGLKLVDEITLNKEYLYNLQQAYC